MKCPLTLLRLYLAQLWTHLSVFQYTSQRPFQKTTAAPSKTTNQTYMATFIVWTMGILYGTIGLHFESGQPLTFRSLRHSKFLMWRQFFIRPIWPQMDVLLIVVTLSITAMIYDFSQKRPIPSQYQYTININTCTVQLGGKDLNAYQSRRLLAIFRYSRITYNLFGLVIYTIAMLYIEVMVFFVSKVYFVSLWSLVFWIIIWPFVAGCIILFIFINNVHIIVCGGCIQIRQQYICQQFCRLLAKLLHSSRSHSLHRHRRLWFYYLILNRTVLSIGKQLVAFNTFWTNHLTLIFLAYSVIQVMYTYVIFFGPSNQTNIIIAMKGMIIVASIEMTVLLFGLIEYCARVVKQNGQIGRLNRRFAVHCLRHQKRYRLRVRQLLKLELFQWPRLLHFYAFKLFGNSRITSKTFYTMAINISDFFLFVMKNLQ